MNIVGIIPARFNSSRLPGKPLEDINGVSMVMRVVHQARKAGLSEVIVATDDDRIFEHVINHGAKAVMTSPLHPSGTDRCLEAALQCKTMPDAVINIQGDEPFIEPEVINKLALLLRTKDIQICTLIKEFDSDESLQNPNRVKVIIDNAGKALSFSRKVGDASQKQFQHLGIYGYSMQALKEITQLEQSPLELKEKLEQLRWFENGYDIYNAQVQENSVCVDTPEDLETARALAKKID
jgi:3-deoxy-manno-octulosonate cytidylyltransferase (CMP-KDO synthetase)